MAEQQHCGDDDPNLRKVGVILEEVDGGDFVDEVEIEIYAKENRKPPKARRYKIRIDREKLLVEKRHVDGDALLHLVGKSSKLWRIYQKRHGGHVDEVKPTQMVDLGECGIERFTTVEKAQQDGEDGAIALEAPPRRVFRLPEDDEAYLDTLGLRWETVEVSGGRWVLIHEHLLPNGYNHATVTLAIRIEGGYPPAALDMCYVFPALARNDGKAIANLSTQAIGSDTYQRWSRHYAWREGDDTFVSHHLKVTNWLAEELQR